MVICVYYALLVRDVIHRRISVVGIESKTCLINGDIALFLQWLIFWCAYPLESF